MCSYSVCVRGVCVCVCSRCVCVCVQGVCVCVFKGVSGQRDDKKRDKLPGAQLYYF